MDILQAHSKDAGRGRRRSIVRADGYAAISFRLDSLVLTQLQGILTPEASKVNSALILKLFLPLLIFATVVPSFERENMGQVGMVLVTGFLFQAMGLFFGIIVRQFTPMPKNWRGGVWAAGMMSNWGDLVCIQLE